MKEPDTKSRERIEKNIGTAADAREALAALEALTTDYDQIVSALAVVRETNDELGRLVETLRTDRDAWKGKHDALATHGDDRVHGKRPVRRPEPTALHRPGLVAAGDAPLTVGEALELDEGVAFDEAKKRELLG